MGLDGLTVFVAVSSETGLDQMRERRAVSPPSNRAAFARAEIATPARVIVFVINLSLRSRGRWQRSAVDQGP